MKKILAIFLVSVGSFGAMSQTAQDFSLTDLDGVSHNLYSTLDNDTVVVLKFFTNWCSVCNNTAPQVVGLYNEYVFNEQPVTIWAIDRQDAEGTAGPTSFRDNHSLPFPVFAFGETVANSFGVQYQPEYRTVCKDRSYSETVSYSQVDQHVQTCLAQLGVGIEDQELDGNFFSYQENGITTLMWDVQSTEVELSIIDVSGRIVLKKLVGAEASSEELDLPSGIYTAVLGTDYGKGSLRFPVIK